jgi:hypothetical protein
MSDFNDELNALALALTKAAIGESNMIIHSVKIDWDDGIRFQGQKTVVRVSGDVTGELELSGQVQKTVSKLFRQHKLVKKLKEKDHDIQIMIDEQKETLAALAHKDKEINQLKDRLARLHKLSEVPE